jgi:proton glutamate symport protein
MIKTTETIPPIKRPWYKPSLTTQILIGLVLGGVLGWLSPAWGDRVYFLRDIFLNMIKSIIAPLVFSTLVVGIAGGVTQESGSHGCEGADLF